MSETAFTYHAYQGADDLTAMQQALAGWIQENGCCGYGHVGDLPHRIYNGLRGRYPLQDMIRLWYNEGQLAGFALVYPRHKGYDVMISPLHRAGTLENEALNWAYTTLRAWLDREDAGESEIMADAYDCDTQRANCLLELGYQPDEAPWITINERPITANLPDDVLPDGYSIRSVIGEEDAADLAAVHSGSFGSTWSADLYRDEVMRKPGYDPALEHVVVAPDGTFAAFCITWMDSLNGIGLFEPVGTHKAHQRRGLGRALMTYGLRFLQERGMQIAQVGSTTDNPASNGLYQAVGFMPKYPIIAYRKY